MPKEIDIESMFSTFHLRLFDRDEVQSLHRYLKKKSALPAEDEMKACIMLCSYYGVLDKNIFQEALQKFLRIYKHHFSIEFQAWANLYKARLAQVQGDMPETMRLYRRAAMLAERGFPRIQAMALHRLGEIYNFYGATEEATDCFVKSISISESINSFRWQVISLSSLSGVFVLNKQAQQALDICRQGLKISNAANDRLMTMRLHIRECSILIELGKTREVFEILRSVRQEIKNHPLPPNEVNSLLGKAYRLQKNYVESERELKRSVSIAKERTNLDNLPNAMLLLAELYLETKKYDAAASLINEAKKISEKSNDMYELTNSLELSVTLYENQNEYKKALEAYREFNEMNQKIFSQQTERRLELLRIEHQVKEKEQEAEAYRLKSEQLEKQLMDKTAHLVMQADSISEFREELKDILVDAKDPTSGLRNVKSKLKDLQHIAVDWEEYDKNFSAVHPKFKQTVTERYPNLTTAEIKVCTLIRMELSTREIAKILNLSERTVENHRYRAKKKMNVGDQDNFVLYLANL